MATLKECIRSGGISCGPFLKIMDPAVVEVAALAGFGHVIIDLEHGPGTIESAQDLVRAAEARGIAPLIRVGTNSESAVLRALDIGAEGVHVPHVSSVEDATRALGSCYYHPAGHRGVCRFVRAAGYSSQDKQEYFAAANARTVPVLHIEGTAGIESLPDILELNGHGVLFLGPYDLSQSCGVPGQVHHPDVVARMRKAVQLGREQEVAVGTFVDTVEDARVWVELGVQYICLSVDVGIFYDACAGLVKEFAGLCA